MRPRSDLHPYQGRVITHLYENEAALAVLKMGAGKTISALTAIDELISDGHARHALVIAPKRVASRVWRQEAKRWQHTAGLDIVLLEGPPLQRAAILRYAYQRHVTVCGIDNVQWLVDELTYVPDDHPVFDLLVIDETSRFKAPGSKRGRALAKLAERFRTRWGLTGTPRPNGLMDLWLPMRLIAGADRIWPGGFYKWQRANFYPTDYEGHKWAPLPGRDEVLMEEAARLTITLGEDELPGLPELSVLVETVDLPEDARQAYATMERKLFAAVEGRDIVAASAAVATGKLAQMANGYVYGEGGAGDAEHLHDAKREWLQEIIEDLQGEPAIVVYEYLKDRAIIREVLGDIPFLGGEISDRDADAAIDAWNARKLPYLGLHPASGGHGLNLQFGGSRMLWMAPTWSAELWDQTIARLARPGQTEHVMVHVCCARATVDQMKRARVIGKLSAQAAFEQYLQHRGALTTGHHAL